jgi:hypothetical protein
MPHEALDRFGDLLIRKVRQESLWQWETLISGELKGERADRIKPLLAQLGEKQEAVFLRLLPEVVDTVLHFLLWMIEHEKEIQLGLRVNDKTYANLREISDGLAGELYGQRGWIKRFGGTK